MASVYKYVRLKKKILYEWRSLGILLIIIYLIKILIIQADFGIGEMAATTYIAENSPYRIYINLDEQIMYVFKNEELYKTYPVSGGKDSTPSPTGEWIIIHKAKWGGNYGGAWMGLNVPWGKYGIHGTNKPWFIGQQNVSGGCIRMKNEDARELYEYIPHGTKVTIVHESRPFRDLKSGNIGSDVYKVQIALKALGYFNNWCDGKFGESTKKAVLAFQKDKGLAETGIVNKSTWDKLMKLYEESLLE